MNALLLVLGGFLLPASLLLLEGVLLLEGFLELGSVIRRCSSASSWSASSCSVCVGC